RGSRQSPWTPAYTQRYSAACLPRHNTSGAPLVSSSGRPATLVSADTTAASCAVPPTTSHATSANAADAPITPSADCAAVFAARITVALTHFSVTPHHPQTRPWPYEPQSRAT